MLKETSSEIGKIAPYDSAHRMVLTKLLNPRFQRSRWKHSADPLHRFLPDVGAMHTDKKMGVGNTTNCQRVQNRSQT